MSRPKLSIVTPSFNQGRFIEQTILSVLRQDYDNYEYIIMDGGSSDETLEIVERYSARIAYWESGKDEGQSHAIAKGFSRATGDLLAYINSDDVYFPGAFSSVAKAYQQNPNASIYSGAIAIGDAAGRIGKCSVPTAITPFFANHGVFGFGQPSSFFNAKVYRRIPDVTRSLHMRMDADLMFRLYRERPEAVVVEDLIGYFRWHPASKSSLAEGRYLDERRHFRESVGMSRTAEILYSSAFKVNRVIAGGYAKSLFATLRYKGKNVADFWEGRG
ncbi:MAG TPA: glycosyltransferase family 2 protein [Spirochaetota bacterium]|nr:glycosyltransferase family 2 protein [Spirochaetota bacterium]